jgi:hypothetical protein
MPDPQSETGTPDKETAAEASGFGKPVWLAGGALILGLAFEVLFYGRPLGISFPIWTWLCLGALIAFGIMEGIGPSPLTIGLSALTALLAILPVFRTEPLTVFLDVVFVLAGLALIVRDYRHGDLLSYGFLDFGLGLIIPPLEAWLRPWRVLSEARSRLFRERGSQSTLASVGRGLLLAFPILVVFLVLLSSADLVFGDYVSKALSWLDLSRFFDYLGRLTVILFVGLFCLGAFVAALHLGEKRNLIGAETPMLAPFLGFTEATVVLAAVDLLFALFVIVQFRYLFGGQANISAAGYTYSDYARRGFAELVFLALLTLGMILALAAWTRRSTTRQTSTFNVLSGLLVLLTGVILASAFTRLLLYEEAYGFSRLRTYTHVAIIWMGVLFLAFLGLLLAGRLRAFAVACAAGAIGFCLTLNLLNVDAFIVRQNFANPSRAGELDAAYLATLSADAVPALVARLDQIPTDSNDDLLPSLACDLHMLRDRESTTAWPSYRWAYASALDRLETIAPSLAGYDVQHGHGSRVWTVTLDEGNYYCTSYGF